jgi:hypothetical protein
VYNNDFRGGDPKRYHFVLNRWVIVSVIVLLTLFGRDFLAPIIRAVNIVTGAIAPAF